MNKTLDSFSAFHSSQNYETVKTKLLGANCDRQALHSGKAAILQAALCYRKLKVTAWACSPNGTEAFNKPLLSNKLPSGCSCLVLEMCGLILFEGCEQGIFSFLNPVAPSIYENEDIKKGILCQLFGGANKDFADTGRGKFRFVWLALIVIIT